MIVLFQSEYELLTDEIIRNENFVMVSISTNTNKIHQKNKSISALYFYFIDADTEYILPINHYDTIYKCNFNELQNLIYSSTAVKYLINKKNVLYRFPKIQNTVDVELCDYLYRLNLNVESYKKHHSLRNTVYPIIKHLEYCQDVKNIIVSNLEKINKIKNVKFYKFYNNTVIPLFFMLESTGLNVNRKLFESFAPDKLNHLNKKNNLIYSQYNLYTATGRPSNTFSNFNFAALNKSDDTRSLFISRNVNGKLIEFDYSAFHPHLILNLLNFKIDENNIYEYLSKFFYDTPNLTPEQHEETKKWTFQLIYGGIYDEFNQIPFFSEITKYIDKIWKEYKENGFIKSPISGRILHKKFYKDDPEFGKYKLWNYLIQLLETEHNIIVLKDIYTVLKQYKSKLILYTYDSFLFDYSPEDDQDELIEKLNSIITQSKYPVSIKIGDNYKEMIKI